MCWCDHTLSDLQRSLLQLLVERTLTPGGQGVRLQPQPRPLSHFPPTSEYMYTCTCTHVFQTHSGCTQVMSGGGLALSNKTVFVVEWLMVLMSQNHKHYGSFSTCTACTCMCMCIQCTCTCISHRHIPWNPASSNPQHNVHL